MNLLLPLNTYATMRSIAGWFDEAEADLLLSAAIGVLSGAGEARNLVEVGSYLGKSTSVLGRVVRSLSPQSRVWAIDPHEGVVGADGERLHQRTETLTDFRRNMEAAGVADAIETIVAKSWEVAWNKPIHLLFIDGLHDYENVARDFRHFEPWIAPDGVILFHDYASYYPGVVCLVDELIASGAWKGVAQAGSLKLIRRA
jgi:predicted O-methyltransferase YrrM